MTLNYDKSPKKKLNIEGKIIWEVTQKYDWIFTG